MRFAFKQPVIPHTTKQNDHPLVRLAWPLMRLVLCVCLAIGFAWHLTGCGGEDADNSAENATERTPQQGQEAGVPSRSSSAGSDEIAGLDVWDFFPEDAHGALVIPSLERLVEQNLMPLLRRHGPDGWDPDAVNADWAAFLAKGVGAPHDGEAGVVQQLDALGVDTQAAMGAYFWLDFDVDHAPAETDEGDDDTEESRWVLALPLQSPERALQPLEARALQSAAEKAVHISNDGDRILQHPSGKLHFANLGHYLLLGPHRNDMEEALAAARRPHPAFYGAEVMPASEADDGVLLFNLQQYAQDQRSMLDALPEADPVAMALREQQAMFDSIIGAGDTFSPMVTTLQWEADALHLLGRMNLDHYPGMRAMTGEPGVHRWIQRLPEATDSYLSLAFSEEMKGNILNMLLPFIDMGEAQDMMSPVVLAPQLTPLIGDELMLGLLAENESNAPYTYLAISMENLDGARLLLQLVLPMTELETYRGNALYAVDLDENAVPFYLAFVDRSIVGSNHLDGLKEMIGHAEDGTTTSPNAPIHAAKSASAPRYTGLVLKTDTLEEFMRGLYAIDLLEGDMLNPVTEFLLRAVSELHLFNTLEEPYQQLEMTLNLR